MLSGVVVSGMFVSSGGITEVSVLSSDCAFIASVILFISDDVLSTGVCAICCALVSFGVGILGSEKGWFLELAL